MDDSLLLRIALVCAALGLIVLYAISISRTSDEICGSSAAQWIEAAEEGSGYMITGKITRADAREGITFIELEAVQRIPVILFGSANISKGEYVRVSGTITEYEGEKEIVADRLDRAEAGEE